MAGVNKNKISFLTICFFIIYLAKISIVSADVQSINDCKQYVADEHKGVQELNVYYFRLALCESEFLDNGKDFNTVVDLFKKATVSTSISFEPQAYYALGFLYETKYKNGQSLYGVPGQPSDLAEAIRYYEKTASLGCSLAKYKLALIQLPKRKNLGNITKADDLIQSIQWLTQAAKEGNAEAQSQLSDWYRLGIGVSQDLLQAYLWQSVAISNQEHDKVLVASPIGSQFLNAQKQIQTKIYSQLSQDQKNKVKVLLPHYYSEYLKPPSSVEKDCEQMQSLLGGNTLRKVLKKIQSNQLSN